MKYEDSIKELESIVRRMENDELDIDTLATQLKRAQTLIKSCRDKLTKTDEEIKSILAGDYCFLSHHYATAQDTPRAVPIAASTAEARFQRNFISLDLFSCVITLIL